MNRGSRPNALLALSLALILGACVAPAHENPHVQAMVAARVELRQAPTSRSANAAANQALHSLIQDQSQIGDEALALLAGYYLGESNEPECEILARGRRMLSLLEAADRNPNELPLRRPGSQSRSELAELIRQGKLCDG
jgi:hypothetical protein